MSAALRKLARFTETDDFLDVMDLGAIVRYAIDWPGLWEASPLAEDIEAWAAAALTRISRVAPPRSAGPHRRTRRTRAAAALHCG